METRAERAERKQLEAFAKLYNHKYGTDYRVGGVEPQNSIIDRRLISVTQRYPEIKVQLKSVTELDDTYFTRSIMGNIKVMDRNIFKILDKLWEKVKAQYRGSENGITIVFEVAVSESWVKDYETPEDMSSSSFEGIFCLGLPTYRNNEGYIFKLK